MLECLLGTDNAIVLLAKRTRARQSPRWLHTLDTLVPYLLMVVVTLLFVNSIDTGRSSYYWSSGTNGTINSLLFTLNVLVVLRLTIEGAAMGRLVQRGMPDLLKTTSMTTGRILLGMWSSTVHRMRAWALLLIYSWGLATLILLALSVYAHPNASSLITLLIAVCFLLLLLLLSISGAVGIGAAMGAAMHYWGESIAIAAALTVQFIPILAAITLLTINAPYVFSNFSMIFDSLFLQPTYMAFGDGGLIAINRLVIYGASTFGIERMSIFGVPPEVFLAMMCTLHVHLLLAGGSAISLAFQMRPAVWSAARQPIKLWKYIDGIVPYMLFVIAALVLVVIWLGIPRVPLTIDLPPFPYINRNLLRAVQYFMAIVLTLSAMRSIAAGVYAAHSDDSASLWVQFLATTRATVSRLRGWILGLGLLLMLLFMLLIIDHFLNGLGLRTLATSEGYWWHWGARQRYDFSSNASYFLQWSPLQVIGAVAWAIIMGYGVIIGGVVLGLGARLVWRHPGMALAGAVLLRALPVLIGLLPPNYFTLPHAGLLATRLDHDPLFTIADSGLTVLIGLAEPGWVLEDHCGDTLASFGVILGVITFYGLLMVTILPVIIAWFREIRPWHSSPLRGFRSRIPAQEIITRFQPP